MGESSEDSLSSIHFIVKETETKFKEGHKITSGRICLEIKSSCSRLKVLENNRNESLLCEVGSGFERLCKVMVIKALCIEVSHVSEKHPVRKLGWHRYL